MIQTINRIRIRKHEGKDINIYYSDDINKDLMNDVYDYYRNKTEKSISITGFPAIEKSKRNSSFLKKVEILCTEYPDLFNSISECKPYTLNIKLKDILKLIPMKDRKSRSYKSLKELLHKEYQITLSVS